MIDESRVGKWASVLKELMGVAGASEFSSIFPSAEIVDAAPADLPADYIRVIGRSGAYEPALTVPGVTYNLGDKVVLLYVKGTEAIALAHAPGSSGGGGGGWKPGNLIVLSSSGDGDYTDLATALAAMVAGDVLLVDAGTYTIPVTGVEIPANCSVIGVGMNLVTLTWAGASAVALEAAIYAWADTYIGNLSVTVADTGHGISAIRMGNGAGVLNVTCDHVKVTVNNVANAVGFYVSTVFGFAVLRNCEAYTTGTPDSNGIQGSSYSTLLIEGGRYDGSGKDINNAHGDPARIYGAVCVNGTVYGSALLGWFYDGSGKLYSKDARKGSLLVGSGGSVVHPEPFEMLGVGADGEVLTADSAQAYGVKWAVASGGWPYSHVLTVDPTDTDADYDTLTDACAAAVAGDAIQFGAGTYTENFTIPEGVAVIGVDVDTCSIVGTVTMSDGSRLALCNVYQSTDNGTTAIAVTTAASAEVELFAVKAVAYVSAGGIARPFENNGTAHVRCCWFTADGATTVDTDLVLDADAELTEPAPNNNQGGLTFFKVGTSSMGSKYRAVVGVVLSGISDVITAASLFLYNAGGTNYTFDINVYRILTGNAGWAEGTSVDTPEVGAVCWNKRVYNTDNWAGSVGCGTADTDYDSTRLGYKNRNWDLAGWDEFVLNAAEVEKLRDGTYDNAGMVIISGSEGDSDYRASFRSKEYATPSYRPYLRVTTGIAPTLQSIYTDAGCTTYLHNLPTLIGDLAGTGTCKGMYLDTNSQLCDPDAGIDEILVASAGGGPAVWQAPAAAVPPHYRKGCIVEYVNAGNIRVSQGVLEINGTQYELTTDSGLIDLATAGNWLNGSEGASQKVYIYATPNGTSLTIKLSDEPPLYPKCDTSSLAFYAQLSANPAAEATSLIYDNDTGEANVRAGDILRGWTDSDYGTVRCGWEVTAINTGTNTITVKANNGDAADNDYITVVKGTPRYRQYAGVWYRCLGMVRNNSSSNLLIFHEDESMQVIYDDPWSDCGVLSAGAATTMTDVDASAFIPPWCLQANYFLYAERTTADCYITVRSNGSAAVGWVLYARGYSNASVFGPVPNGPNQCIEYLVNNVATDGYIWVHGYKDMM